MLGLFVCGISTVLAAPATTVDKQNFVQAFNNDSLYSGKLLVNISFASDELDLKMVANAQMDVETKQLLGNFSAEGTSSGMLEMPAGNFFVKGSMYGDEYDAGVFLDKINILPLNSSLLDGEFQSLQNAIASQVPLKQWIPFPDYNFENVVNNFNDSSERGMIREEDIQWLQVFTRKNYTRYNFKVLNSSTGYEQKGTLILYKNGKQVLRLSSKFSTDEIKNVVLTMSFTFRPKSVSIQKPY